MPLLLWVEIHVWNLPFPRSDAFYSLISLTSYVVLGGISFLVALPGFVLAKLLLWKLGAESTFAYGLAGLFTGILGAVLAFLPDQLWGLWHYNLIAVAAVTGVFAGLFYRTIEAAIFKGFSLATKPLNLGDSGN